MEMSIFLIVILVVAVLALIGWAVEKSENAKALNDKKTDKTTITSLNNGVVTPVMPLDTGHNALNIIVPLVDDVRTLRHTFVSHMSEAGITLAVLKTKVPIDHIDEWISDASDFHQKVLSEQHFMSAEDLKEASSNDPLGLENPILSKLTMLMMLGTKYKESLSEWIADLPAAIATGKSFTAADQKQKSSLSKDLGKFGILVVCIGFVFGGALLYSSGSKAGINAGMSLVILGFVTGLNPISYFLLKLFD